ncbi:type II toxin-antitoxin system VapC family toxin [Hoylesella enoeca]|uniref:type II toxin-antitoxin system VapC family toxin n=1 Tax=Hoylesella enoeca TaxID=76123 RepID=UPI0028893E62|nr:PIN domain-containing protein [Hoylesella enoeca]
MKVFLDNNILIDLLSNRGAFTSLSFQVIKSSIMKGNELFISSLSVANACYITRKELSDSVFKQKIYALRPDITITEIGQEAILFALDSDWTDFEDALQYYSAQEVGANVIVTRNKRDFDKSLIPVQTPQEFLHSK